MRLFIAAELPEPLTEALSETSALLRDQVRGRYVPPTNFHVTLAFLGEVDGSGLALAGQAVERACEEAGPFEVVLGGLGSFGGARRAALWQGFARGEAELGDLAQAVRSSLSSVGISYDGKGFVPHVTLMRSADLTVSRLPMPVVAASTIDRVSIFRSDLTGKHPRYDALQSVDLS